MRHFHHYQDDTLQPLPFHRSGELAGRRPVAEAFLGKKLKPIVRQKSVATRMGNRFAKQLLWQLGAMNNRQGSLL